MSSEAGPSGVQDLDQAITLINNDKVTEAVELLAHTLKSHVDNYGELARECAPVYFRYGQALLFQAQDAAKNMIGQQILDDAAKREGLSLEDYNEEEDEDFDGESSEDEESDDDQQQMGDENYYDQNDVNQNQVTEELSKNETKETQPAKDDQQALDDKMELNETNNEIETNTDQNDSKQDEKLNVDKLEQQVKTENSNEPVDDKEKDQQMEIQLNQDQQGQQQNLDEKQDMQEGVRRLSVANLQEQKSQDQEIKTEEGCLVQDEGGNAEGGEGDGDDDDMGVDEEEDEDVEEEDKELTGLEADWQLAWQNLEIARCIYEKYGSEVNNFELAEIQLCLGDVNGEREDFDAAISDYQLSIQLFDKCLPTPKADSELTEQSINVDEYSLKIARRKAEALFKLALMLQFTLDYKEAEKHVEVALDVMKKHQEACQKALEACDKSGDSKDYIQKYLNGLPQTIEDLQDFLEELKECQKSTSLAGLKAAIERAEGIAKKEGAIDGDKDGKPLGEVQDLGVLGRSKKKVIATSPSIIKENQDTLNIPTDDKDKESLKRPLEDNEKDIQDVEDAKRQKLDVSATQAQPEAVVGGDSSLPPNTN